MNNQLIHVTKPYLPPLSEFTPLLENIWKSGVLTNGGPYHQELENALCEYLGVKYVSLFANGTVALLTALQALDIKGEVITTPFSFVATSHALMWNNLKPVFVDIDPNTFCIDPAKVEHAITCRTTAILPVHCYGYPCDVVSLEKIAKKHNLKLIYDAAHAFGVCGKDGSILNEGDLSVLSFHATKVFNTFEGGAIVSNDLETKKRIDRLKNFGIVNELSVTEVGINGKMSELNAAFGMLQLRYIDSAILMRKTVDQIYRDGLGKLAGIRISRVQNEIVHNYAYFPILITGDSCVSRDELYDFLRSNGIYTRKYFYPLISSFPEYCNLTSSDSNNLTNSISVSNAILCLPIYPDLEPDDQLRIINLIVKAVRN